MTAPWPACEMRQRAGTFTKVPLCAAATQTGCAIAFSSYPSQPSADSVFGRPGQGVSLQSGQTAKAGQQVACVNPAALAGGVGDLDAYLLTATQTPQVPIPGYERLTEPVSTPWVTYPGLYSARCEQGGGGHLAPGHQPRRDQPNPARRERQPSERSSRSRYRTGIRLPRLRVRPHPGQPTPGRHGRGNCLGVESLIRPAGRPLSPDLPSRLREVRAGCTRAVTPVIEDP